MPNMKNLHAISGNIPDMTPLREACRRLNNSVSYDFLRKGCLSGKFVHIRVGTKILINFDKLCEYLERGEELTPGGIESECEE